MGQVAARCVVMQDVQNEQMDGGDRIKEARAPLVADLATEGENCGGVKQGSKFYFAMSEDFCHCANHPKPPVGEISDPTIVQELFPHPMSLTIPRARC